jgi:hypothetical protein
MLQKLRYQSPVEIGDVVDDFCPVLAQDLARLFVVEGNACLLQDLHRLVVDNLHPFLVHQIVDGQGVEWLHHRGDFGCGMAFASLIPAAAADGVVHRYLIWLKRSLCHSHAAAAYQHESGAANLFRE